MKAAQAKETTGVTFGPLQVAILLLGLAAALIHLVVLNSMMVSNFGHIDLLFTLNGLGYLALLAAYFLPIPLARENRSLVRYGLIGLTALTIVAWLIMGRPYTTLGYITAAIEVVLIILLIVDARR